jgi:hypothetical protein
MFIDFNSGEGEECSNPRVRQIPELFSSEPEGIHTFHNGLQPVANILKMSKRNTFLSSLFLSVHFKSQIMGQMRNACKILV